MLSQETINNIQILYAGGLSKTAIAKQLHVSAATVGKYTKDVKVVRDEMVGKTFGSLTVIQRLEKNPNLASRSIRYLCKCQCGKEIEANGNSLRTGHTTSCGCSRKGATAKDLTNMFSGEIKFLYPTEERQDGHIVWQCKCSCGRYIKLTSHEFGHTKSCGCIKESLGEKLIKQILVDNNVQFQTQYRFEDCTYKRSLPFDFAIFEKGRLICLIEYNGQQHYQITGGWNTKEQFELRQERDRIKEQYCDKNNIKLITIPYFEYDNLSWEYLKGLIYDGLSSNS